MRKLIYTVKKEDGTVFNTPHYNEAKKEGNKIITTYLEPVEILTPKQWEERKAKAQERLDRIWTKAKAKQAEG